MFSAKGLWGRLLFLLNVAVIVPMLVAGFVMIYSAEGALVAEKQQKLFGAAHMLDGFLKGSYEDLLKQYDAESDSKEEQIAVLNTALKDYTEQVALAYPGIGVGYYDKKLDAIITYGPHDMYGDTVGMPIGPSHEGRVVMETGVARVQEANLVRGYIMNAMIPVIRNEEVIGYIWSNELTADIQTQIRTMKRHMYLAIFAGMAVGLFGISYLIRRTALEVKQITRGLGKVRNNLAYRIPEYQYQGELGEIARAINVTTEELAARKEREAKIYQAERLAALGELAAGLAHEIRNPLMAIRGFAELLKEENAREEQDEYAEIIVQETERLNHLIEQLLCFSRPSPTVVNEVDVLHLIHNLVLLVRPKASELKVRLITNLEANLPYVLADIEQLKQVLLNIMINAIQAIKQEGIVRIEATFDEASKQVKLDITDNGIGMDEENLAKIFDPFFTTKEDGTGLGLALTHRMVENWGGHIFVQSELGKGSTFTLMLPVKGGEKHGQVQESTNS